MGLSWHERSYCSANTKDPSSPLTSVCSLIDRMHTDNVPNYFSAWEKRLYNNAWYPLKFIPFLLSTVSDLHSVELAVLLSLLQKWFITKALS